MKIWMFVYNNCKHDARVLKEARTLTEAGHEVKIVAILDRETEPVEVKDGFRILRVNRLLPLNQQVHQTSTRAEDGENRSLRKSLFNIYASVYRWAKNHTRGPLRKFLVAIYRPLSFLKYYRNSWKLVKNEPADVYHCHDLNTLLLGYLARRRHGGKLVYDSHELATELAYIFRHERLVWKVLERLLIHRADRVIATGKHRGEYLEKKYGISPPTVLLNCPPAYRELNPGGITLRDKLELVDSSTPVVLYSGGFQVGRALPNLIRAAAYLTRGVMVFMGWGALEQELKDTVREEGLDGKVLFLESIPPYKIVDFITSATVGVVPAQFTSLNNYYATPNKLYEYIQAGLPVVSSNFPALQEIVEGYGFGKTFDPEIPQNIADSINYVLADKNRYNEMRKNALEAAKIFNWENESVNLINIYEQFQISKNDSPT